MRLRSPGQAEAGAEQAAGQAVRSERGADVASLANAGPSSVMQRRLQNLADHGPQAARQSALQAMADRSALSGGRAGAGAGVAQLLNRQGTTLDGKATNVDWQTGSLGGSNVGLKMEASLLGPDHEQGGPPAYGAQSALMGKLNTNPSSANDSKYIRGHLLNDNLGGQGQDYNLYPLTGNANKEHHDRIESYVKNWVNIERQWVSYKVEVAESAKKLNSSDVTKNYVDATFTCRAAVLDPTNLKKEIKSVSAVIKSEYKVTNREDEVTVNGGAKLPAKGLGAASHKVKLSSSKKSKKYAFDDALFQAIKNLYEHGYIDKAEALFGYINKVTGIGDGTVEAYKTLINEALEDNNNLEEDLPLSVKLAITNMNKRAYDIIRGINFFIKMVEKEEDKDEDYVVPEDDEISDDDMVDEIHK